MLKGRGKGRLGPSPSRRGKDVAGSFRAVFDSLPGKEGIARAHRPKYKLSGEAGRHTRAGRVKKQVRRLMKLS